MRTPSTYLQQDAFIVVTTNDNCSRYDDVERRTFCLLPFSIVVDVNESKYERARETDIERKKHTEKSSIQTNDVKHASRCVVVVVVIVQRKRESMPMNDK